MKILFGALHSGYYRNVESVVEELALRGHEIYLGTEKKDSAFGGQPIVDRLVATYPNVTCGPTPERRDEELEELAARVRHGLYYLRYLDPLYARSGLVHRARLRTPLGVLQLSQTAVCTHRFGRYLVARALDAIDLALPPSQAIEEFLDARRPDLVAITPLIGLGASSQVDLLRSALRRRIPTAVVVFSWDHLSSKAFIRDVPDRVVVWNETQKREAMDMHGVPAERVAVTGAHCYDRWFQQKPSRSRLEFVRHVGLTDERPYVLWAGSALLPGSPPEPEVFFRWISHLRRSNNPRVCDVPVLIRPHPSRADEWTTVDWRRFGNVAMFVSPPVDAQSRMDYFDSLYHSGAVVGITTSAFLEAAIAGRPVMSFFSDDLRQEHEESLHFQYLLHVEGGLVTTAGSLDEHVEQIAVMLDGPPPDVLERQRRFINAFVRPGGLDRPATGVAADALETLGSAKSVARPRRPSPLGQLGLTCLKRFEQHPRWQRLFLNQREAERLGEKTRIRTEALMAKQLQREEKARRRAARGYR